MERCEELESSTMMELYTVIAGPSVYSSSGSAYLLLSGRGRGGVYIDRLRNQLHCNNSSAMINSKTLN